MRAERDVAAKLRAQLVSVTRPEKTCRASLATAHQHADAGDLHLDGTRWWVEVKARRQRFGAVPCDFPHQLVLVDTTKAVASQRKKIAAWVIVSQPTRACVVVPASSAPRWTASTIETLDGQKTAYFVPRRCLRSFDDFAAWARACQAQKSV
jgi:hypothetical protein